MSGEYRGALTREQFLYYEIRLVAVLQQQGFSREDILKKVKEENLFQFPTEREVTSITRACFRRLDALDSRFLTELIASAPAEVGKQINLYAVMRDNRLVWDFMTQVIGEKYRTQDLAYSRKDLNVFFRELQEQNEKVAGWSDATVGRIKMVLNKCLVECGYLDSTKSEVLNAVLICPELEDEIRAHQDLAALPAFNCFR